MIFRQQMLSPEAHRQQITALYLPPDTTGNRYHFIEKYSRIYYRDCT
jgi:hypothetical protein